MATTSTKKAKKVFDAAWAAHKEKITACESIDYKTLIESQDTKVLTNASATTMVLKLDDTTVGIDDVKKIATSLVNNATITTNRLACNNIDDDNEKMKINTTVATLDITHNKIGDNGASALADMLMTN